MTAAHPDLLRRAAAKLRESAEGTTPPPWMSASETNRKNSIALVGAVAKRGTGEAIAVLAGDPRTRHADARWIALVDPAVAGPLAALLEASAAELDEFAEKDQDTSHSYDHLFTSEVAVARVVLREPDGGAS